jgi:hypothetical protein
MHENSLSVSKLIYFTLLSRPANAQHTHTHTHIYIYTRIYIYIYIYIKNILYTVITPACFDASASSSGVLSFYCAKVTKLLKLQLNKVGRLKCLHI